MLVLEIAAGIILAQITLYAFAMVANAPEEPEFAMVGLVLLLIIGAAAVLIMFPDLWKMLTVAVVTFLRPSTGG